ncbi:hypothetical protein [Companilactobacillus nuruki]|uniref:Uncharacterized protein n=1 Tax=Companilactobacillus nuruki TaxID=1993540 RepID=A0A2N7AV18_9LACO|nr:hypothetical protein [Companilactobacillus nuruki]PMD71468.1 hypothetical protein CBP76_04985 [Companilactobacillus nuruki]
MSEANIGNYVNELKDLVNKCADELLEKNVTYKKALLNLRHEQFYSVNQYSTELIKMVSDEIRGRALDQKTN